MQTYYPHYKEAKHDSYNRVYVQHILNRLIVHFNIDKSSLDSYVVHNFIRFQFHQ